MDVNGNVTILRSVLSGNTSPVGVGGAVYMGAGRATLQRIRVRAAALSR